MTARLAPAGRAGEGGRSSGAAEQACAVRPERLPVDALTRESAMNVLRLAVFLMLFLAGAAVAAPNYAREEYIVVSGGPALRALEDYRVPADRHDRFWGNFIRAARIRIQQLRRLHGDAAQITWLVYRPGYITRAREDQVRRPPYICDPAEITRIANNHRVKLVWFSTKGEFISYLNRRGGRKIASFDYFGHSNKFAFLFDYSNAYLGASSCYLHCVDLKRLNRGLFTKNAHVQSWGCHTGEYMSAIWKRATGTPLIGGAKSSFGSGKTDYSVISDGLSLPRLSGRWVR